MQVFLKTTFFNVFRHPYTRKLCYRSLKVELLENSGRCEDIQKQLFQCFLRLDQQQLFTKTLAYNVLLMM